MDRYNTVLTVIVITAATAGLSSGVVSAASGPKEHDVQADTAAITKWIAHESDCEDERQTVEIDDLTYFDFDHDGNDELIVTASTCNTGTAGPDVHSVYSRDGNAGFNELAIPDVDSKYYDTMVGNRNYSLGVENGYLVARWHDRSGRAQSPLTITYKWNERGFIVKAVKAPYLKK
jgi:hypothetical protein